MHKKTLLVLASLAAFGSVAVFPVTGTAPALAQPKPKKLSQQDVIKMSKAGIPDNVIISKINNSGTVFDLEVADMVALKKAGVSDKIIEAMVNTEMSAGRPAAPTPAAAPTARAAATGTPEPSEEESILGVTQPPDGGGADEGGAWGGGAGGNLSQAAALFRDSKWPEASDMLFSLIENRKVQGNDLPEAQLRLADSLYNMGLYQSALYYYSDVVQAGPNSRAFLPALNRVIDLSDKLRDDRRLLQMLQEIDPGKLPSEIKRDAGYFYGLLYFRTERLEDAKRALRNVGKESRFYGKAKYSEGVILSLENNNDAALNAFKEAILHDGMPNASAKEKKKNPELVEQEARLAIARTLYSNEKYPEAVAAFREVSRNGDLWAPSLFDNAWALYKNQEFGSSLGNILSTRSPFFDSFYEPEAKILETIVYYRLCLYPRANKTINDFFAVYSPYSAKIKSFRKQAEKRPPEQVFAFLKDFVDSPKGKAATFMPSDLMIAIAEDGKIADILYHLNAIEYEQQRIRDIGPWRGSRVAAAVMDQMNGHKASLQKLGGKLIIREFEDQDDKLDNLFAQAKTIRFEITLGEKEALEASLLGKSSGAATGKIRDAKIIVPDDHYFWPFEGEYWKDEVGYYRFAVEGECVK